MTGGAKGGATSPLQDPGELPFRQGNAAEASPSPTTEPAAEHGTGHIVQSLVVNLAIAATKAVAAFFTGSGAMLAEAIHSFSDCGNQVLLLVGVKSARRAPDAEHPLGYGRDLYFWSFLVALLLFTAGGVFSVYEGIHKLLEPEKVERVWLGMGILGISLVLEGGATISNIAEINRRRGARTFSEYLRETKDSDLIVVFGENSAAVLGLALALVALGMAAWTHDGRWDAAGSIAIGLVLIGVAMFLAREVKSLLIGEAADPEIARVTREIALEHPHFDKVLHLVTVQQGPSEVMVSMKVSFVRGITIEEACCSINELEARLRARCPEVRWCFVEPDIERRGAPSPGAPRAVIKH